MPSDEEITIPLDMTTSAPSDSLVLGSNTVFNAESLSRLLDNMQAGVVYLRSEYDKVKVRSDEDPKKKAVYEAVNSLFKSALALLRVLPHLSR